MSAAVSEGPKNLQESKNENGSSHEVTICLQCGDEGATNAFIYCVYCLKYAVHRYCLDKLPETLDEFVLWVCDNCDEVPEKVTSSKYVNNTSSIHVENNSKKKQLQGKTNPINNSHKVSRKDVFSHNGTPTLENSEDSDSMVKLDYLHKQCDGDIDLEEIGLKQQQTQNSPISKPSLNSSPLESSEVAQPIIDPIWSGSFNIPNSKESDGEIDRLVVAHLSKKVGKQVYDEARSFPSMLQLELHPKAHVWPKRFQELRPSDDDIAIYFFPLTRRYEGVFDELVEEMMDQELALKAITKNAELLVFPSNELPLNFWRFQGKYFLWGVFRGKQPN